MSRLVFATLLQWVADVRTIAHWPRRFQATKKKLCNHFVRLYIYIVATVYLFSFFPQCHVQGSVKWGKKVHITNALKMLHASTLQSVVV